MLDTLAEAARRDSDGVRAIFHDTRKAVDAAREVDQIAAHTEFPFHFRSRIGVHTEPGSHSLDGDYTEGAAKATRIMQMCPRDYILCSEDTLDEVPSSARASFQTYGPVFCKLRGPTRPVPLYAILGEAASGPPDELAPWQTGQRVWPTLVDPLGVIRTRGPWPYLAAFACEIMWATLRDRALYSLGNWGFRFLHWSTQRLGLDFHIETSRGVADTYMATGRVDKALQWAERAERAARQVRYPGSREFCQAMGQYQVAHCREHGARGRGDALRDLRDAYKRFERMGDPRMGGWAALYLGRCLRLLSEEGAAEKGAAEDWTLAAIVIFSCIPRERPMAYALAQLARLRAAQGRLLETRWYLEQARWLYAPAVGRAAGDAVGEEDLASIWSRTLRLPEPENSPEDTARRTVQVTLARAFPGRFQWATSQ